MDAEHLIAELVHQRFAVFSDLDKRAAHKRPKQRPRFNIGTLNYRFNEE